MCLIINVIITEKIMLLFYRMNFPVGTGILYGYRRFFSFWACPQTQELITYSICFRMHQ